MKDYLLYTDDIHVLVEALRAIKAYAIDHDDEHVPAVVDTALLAIGLEA